MTKPITMDSRKFLNVLNDSAQSNIVFFEQRIQSMGANAGKKWKLVALKPTELMFEDVEANQYYSAKFQKDNRQITIHDIRPIHVVERDKSALFQESCYKLVDALEANDQRGMAQAFNRMKLQRFSNRAIPRSGIVKCRDNVLRKVPVVGEDKAIDSKSRSAIIQAITESVRDRVVVENGQVVCGIFNNGVKIKLPVTKWSTKKAIARNMANHASQAYMVEGFQNRISTISNLITEDKIEEAVNLVKPFLDEYEEFTLLSKKQINTLIENSLATKGIFNQKLCDDTATLFHRTNLHINRSKIIKEWRKIARASEHPVLVENVQTLSESNSFEAAYEAFLKTVFESVSNKEVIANALATTLQALLDKTPRIKESNELSGRLGGLVSRLKGPNFDDAAIYEAEDLIATIQEELSANDTLGDFDQFDDDGLSDELANLSDEADSSAPVININSPLIQIGGTSGTKSEPLDDLGGDLGMDLEGMDEDDELEDEPADEEDELPSGLDADLASAVGPQDAGASLDLAGLGESRRRNKKPLVEDRKDLEDAGWDDFELGLYDNMKVTDRKFNPRKPVMDDSELDLFEMEPWERGAYSQLPDDDDDYLDLDDMGNDSSGVEYGFDHMDLNSNLTKNYGMPVLSDSKQRARVSNIMEQLVEKHGLTGKNLVKNLPKIAAASIKAVGLRLPKTQLLTAIEEAMCGFKESKKMTSKSDQQPFFLYPETKDEEGEEGGEEGEATSESQMKGPSIAAGGYSRNSITDYKVKWKKKEHDAMLGEMANVNFIFDHGGDSGLPPVILSEDGSLEIPIPKSLHDSAFALASGKDDGLFTEWLAKHIEQLRPVSQQEDSIMNEAMVQITASPGGNIDVKVTDDVSVSDQPMGGMEPVDSVMIDQTPSADEDDSMPDFEAMGDDDDMDDDDMDDDDMDDDDMDDDDMDDEDMDEDMDDDMDDEDMDDDMDDEDMDDDMDDEDMDDDMDDDLDDDMDEDMDEDEEINEALNIDEDFVFEDHDITHPEESKYQALLKGNKRDMPKTKLPKFSDDELEEIGPDLETDNGSGTKPPTAKPMSRK